MRDVVLRFMHDDAFYYFGIARRWNRLGFPTFDGITATNGYHPLWQWVLVAASRLFPDPTTFARAGAASGVLFLGLAAWLIARRLAQEGFNAYVTSASTAIEAGTVPLETRAGLRSAPRTLRVRIEPMPGAARLASGIGVWRVVALEP